jgi:sigma-B regulation protein RsbU (phosphoserine phosphatase)
LFLGASLVVCALIVASVAVTQRKRYPLFIWLAVFALLDGSRLWLKSDLPWNYTAMHPGFARVRLAVDFLMPIPTTMFLKASGFFGSALRKFAWLVSILSLLVFARTVLWGYSLSIAFCYNLAMAISIIVFILWSRKDTDLGNQSHVVRWALLSYITTCGLSYVGALYGFHWRIEPVACGFLFCVFGYVVAQDVMNRRRKLHEIEHELKIAREIQLSILPSRVPESLNFNAVARYVPKCAVAGDFYDFVVMDDHQVGLFVADVNGHGVPAALIASMLKLAIDAQRDHLFNAPDALLYEVNRLLCRNAQSQLVTAAYAYLNSDTGELLYSAAGHPPMLLFRHGEVRAIERNGLLMAAFPTASYQTLRLRLHPNDRILLYTDGVTEATNRDGTEFGIERLKELLMESETMSIAELADSIIAAISQWSDTQQDDLTVVLCEYSGARDQTVDEVFDRDLDNLCALSLI